MAMQLVGMFEDPQVESQIVIQFKRGLWNVMSDGTNLRPLWREKARASSLRPKRLKSRSAKNAFCSGDMPSTLLIDDFNIGWKEYECTDDRREDMGSFNSDSHRLCVTSGSWEPQLKSFLRASAGCHGSGAPRWTCPASCLARNRCQEIQRNAFKPNWHYPFTCFCTNVRQFCSQELRNDLDVVLEAVRQDIDM